MRIKGFAAAIGWLAASVSGAAQAPQALRAQVAGQIAGRDLAARPPEVASLHLFRAAANAQGNARLEARFREDLPDVVSVILDGKPVSLRDDGYGEDFRAWDGIYCARVRASEADFRAVPAAQAGPADLVSRSAQERGGVRLALPSDGTEDGLAPATEASLASAAAIEPANLVDPEKALLIRNVNVLNHYFRTTDPCKNVATPAGATPPPPNDQRKWGFGYLMGQMANTPVTGVSASTFALAWLDEWAKTQTINGDLLQEIRFGNTSHVPVAKFIKAQWLKKSGNTGKLDMGKAPFRLLAIVNRVDKRDNLAFGGGTAGELRFVFGVLDLEHVEPGGQCSALGQTEPVRGDGAFKGINTVILEYAVDKATQADVKAWGQKWIELNKRTQNSPEYRTYLEGITESVVKAGVGNAKSRANGSALIVLRTNESDDNNTWDLREFAINKTAKTLKAQTIANTPAGRINGNPDQTANPLQTPPIPGADQTGDLYLWGHANATAIKAEKHVVPLKFPTNTSITYTNTFFRGSHALTNMPPWAFGFSNGDTEMRFRFAVNTCNGCHDSEEMGVVGLAFHVRGRPFGTRSDLSQFLTGAGNNVFSTTPISVTDPITGTVRQFAELARRRQDLANLVSGTTLSSLAFQPLTRSH